jgi:hypothetical protein
MNATFTEEAPRRPHRIVPVIDFVARASVIGLHRLLIVLFLAMPVAFMGWIAWRRATPTGWLSELRCRRTSTCTPTRRRRST